MRGAPLTIPRVAGTTRDLSTAGCLPGGVRHLHGSHVPVRRPLLSLTIGWAIWHMPSFAAVMTTGVMVLALAALAIAGPRELRGLSRRAGLRQTRATVERLAA